MTIAEVENTYIEDLNLLEDWFLQYEYLLEISSDMPKLSDEERTDANKVKGCQSGVWLSISNNADVIHVQADSDTLIIRGILAIIVGIFDGHTKNEIENFQPSFIEKTNIKNQISTDRFNGIYSVINTIKNYAKAV
jgi:cysteine desulfuration protein SufE